MRLQLVPALAGAMAGTVLAVVFGAVLMAPPPAHQPPDPAEQLLDKHECWREGGDAGRTPHGAIVTLPGQRTRWVDASVGFDIWLGDRPGDLHAFCAEGPSNLDTSHDTEDPS